VAPKKVMELSIATWLALVGLILTLVAGGGTILSQIYASKAEVLTIKENLTGKIDHANNEAETRLQNWRIQTIEVKVENIDARQQQTSQNVVKLLERWRLQPAEVPVLKPLPPPPAPAIVADESE
jgi:hypothetical protein